MRILQSRTLPAAMFVLMAGLCMPATADARAKYRIKGDEWLFTQADKARVDTLAQQAASRWNVIGDVQTSAKFKDAGRRYRAWAGSLNDVTGRLDIWKPGELVSVKGYGGKQAFSFVRQTEFRVRETSIGSVHFSETRNLRCLQSGSDRKCGGLALEVWHYARSNLGILPDLVQANVSQTCNLTGKTGVVTWKGHSSIKCTATGEKRPAAMLASSDDGISKEFPRLDVSSDTIVSSGMVEIADEGAQVSFYYALGSWKGGRLEHEVILSSAGADAIHLAYAFMYANPAKNIGGAPFFNTDDGEITIRLNAPFGSFKGLDYLCDKEWGTCVRDHILGWELEPDGRVRLDIDGCKNDICFKGSVYGTHVPPILTLPAEGA